MIWNKKNSATVTINGATFSGSKIDVAGRNIFVDGKKVDVGNINGDTLHVKVEGNLVSLSCSGSATIDGNVNGPVTANGSVSCANVGGDVTANGSINAEKLAGSAKAGGSINIG